MYFLAQLRLCKLFDPAEQTWLVVPLYNEAQVVAEVIANARKTFPNVVCVDDGSRDDSAAQARSAGGDCGLPPA